MRPRFVAASTVVLVASLTTTLPALGSAPARSSGAASSLSWATDSSPVSVRLPTGQRVIVATVDGRPSVRIPPSTAASGVPLQTLTANGHTYVVPVSARNTALLGRDLADFDVTALAGLTPKALPFGTAGRSTTGIDEPWTVTVNGLDRNGDQDTGDIVALMNVDDSSLFLSTAQFQQGTATFTVPSGHYAASAFIVTVTDGSASYTLTGNPEFLVDQDVTVSLDARDGNPIHVRTPRRSTPVHAEVNVQRDPTSGFTFTNSLTTFDKTPVYAAPTNPVDVGRQFFYQTQRRGDRDGSLDRYLYDLDFANRRVVPEDLTTTIRPEDLATVKSRYASVVSGRHEQDARYGGYPWQAIIGGGLYDLTAPTTRTEYVFARPHLRWYAEVDLDPNGFNGRTIAPVDVFPQSMTVKHVWTPQPMGSGLEQQHRIAQVCPICRTGDTLTTGVFPHVDRQNNFMLADGQTTELLTFYQDGDEVGTSPIGFATFPMSPDAASYRLQYDVDHVADWWPTSTHVSTSWSFSSAPGGQQVPPGWTCGGKGLAAPDDCFLQDILTVHWATGAGLDGVVPAGSMAHVRVTVAPQRGLPADPLDKLTAKVSYDGGATWQKVDAAATGNGRTWVLTYQQPELGQTDGFASLRVQAHAGTSGASVKQTVLHAYPLAALGGQ